MACSWAPPPRHSPLVEWRSGWCSAPRWPLPQIRLGSDPATRAAFALLSLFVFTTVFGTNPALQPRPHRRGRGLRDRAGRRVPEISRLTSISATVFWSLAPRKRQGSRKGRSMPGFVGGPVGGGGAESESESESGRSGAVPSLGGSRAQPPYRGVQRDNLPWRR